MHHFTEPYLTNPDSGKTIPIFHIGSFFKLRKNFKIRQYGSIPDIKRCSFIRKHKNKYRILRMNDKNTSNSNTNKPRAKRATIKFPLDKNE